MSHTDVRFIVHYIKPSLYILVNKIIKHKIDEFKQHQEYDVQFKDKLLSVRDSVSIREKESSESEEFNIDDFDEDGMEVVTSKPKAEEKKNDAVKNGGFRDYNIAKQQAETSKMLYKTHDQTMYRGKAFMHAKTIINNKKEGSLRIPVDHYNNTNNSKGELKLKHTYSNILSDVMFVGMQVALRTPTRELELQNDAANIDCLGLSCLQSRTKLDEDPIEYENIKDEYMFMEGSSSGSSLNSPIDTKGCFKFNLGHGLNTSISPEDPRKRFNLSPDDPRGRANSTQRDFLTTSMVTSGRQLAFGEAVKSLIPGQRDYITEQHERQRRIHNSKNFQEILPRPLVNRSTLTATPKNIRASLNNLRIARLPSSTNISYTKQSVKNSVIAEPSFTQYSELKSSQGGFTEQAKNAQFFSAFFSKLHNKTGSSAADSPESKDKPKKKNVIESLLSPGKTLRSTNLNNTSSNAKLTTSSQKNQGILNNLAKLMVSLRTSEKNTKEDLFDFTQSMRLGSTDYAENRGRNASRDNNKTVSFVKRTSIEMKTVESFHITDYVDKYEKPRSRVRRNEKSEYTNILHALHRNDDDGIDTDTERSENTPQNLQRINGFSNSMYFNPSSKQTSTASPKQVASKYRPDRDYGRKEPCLRGLDMITQMSASSLMNCLVKVFHHLDMDPFVVAFF